MFREAKRALYIFLCGLMGALLFLVIQRSLALIYLVMLRTNPGRFGLGMTLGDFIALDLFSVMLALFTGGWYGVWLGVHWYQMVYEHGTFPGVGMHLAQVFSLKNLRGPSKPHSTTAFIPKSAKKGDGSKKEYASFWEVDELNSSIIPEKPTTVVHVKPTKKEPAARKPAVRRIVRRRATKEV